VNATIRARLVGVLLLSLAGGLGCASSDVTHPTGGPGNTAEYPTKLVFVFYPPSEPNGALGVSNVDGTGVVRIAAVPAYSRRFHNLSPDGEYIVFHEGVNDDVVAYVITRTGVRRRLLAPSDMAYSIYPRVSHDGRWVYFAGRNSLAAGEMYAIYRVHPDGSGLIRLTTPTAASRSHTQPASSPDGTLIAYHDDEGLHVLTLATGSIVTISNNGEFPVFSPDGRKIAFVEGISFISASIDGSDRRILEDEVDDFGLRPSWVPASGRVLVRSVYGVESVDPSSGVKTLEPNLKTFFDLAASP
jgi:hypothetical protein